MSTTKHTHGNWMLDEQMSQFAGSPAIDISVGGVDFQKRHIARIVQSPYKGSDVSENEMKANAKLIAAAPELLEALYHVRHDSGTFGSISIKTSKLVDDAIKKATS